LLPGHYTSTSADPGDESWHVLDGTLRFHLADGRDGAHHPCPVPSRHLIFLTPRLERLIYRRLLLTDQSEVAQILAEHDTEFVA
jgi:hypothetical protein